MPPTVNENILTNIVMSPRSTNTGNGRYMIHNLEDALLWISLMYLLKYAKRTTRAENLIRYCWFAYRAYINKMVPDHIIAKFYYAGKSKTELPGTWCKVIKPADLQVELLHL